MTFIIFIAAIKNGQIYGHKLKTFFYNIYKLKIKFILLFLSIKMGGAESGCFKVR